MKTSGSLSNKKSFKSKRGRTVSTKKHKTAKKVTDRSFKRKGTKKLRKKKIRGGDIDWAIEKYHEEKAKTDRAAAEQKAKDLQKELADMTPEQRKGYDEKEEERKKRDKDAIKKDQEYLHVEDKRAIEYKTEYKKIIELLYKNLTAFCGECEEQEIKGKTQKGIDLPEPQRDIYLQWKKDDSPDKKGWLGSGWSNVEKENKIIALQNEALVTLFAGMVDELDDFTGDANRNIQLIEFNTPPYTRFLVYLMYFKSALISYNYTMDGRNRTGYRSFYSTPRTWWKYTPNPESPPIEHRYEVNKFYTHYRTYVKWLKTEMKKHTTTAADEGGWQ